MFDCAFKASKGERSIHYMGHIKMMGATQPFISGAISKTVNVPKDAIGRGHRAGVPRDLAPRRQGRLDLSRRLASARSRSTPRRDAKAIAAIAPKELVDAAVAQALAARAPQRRKLPDERQAITHKFDIAGHEGYITVGLFEDGMPGEIFLVMAKEGSTISGFADAFAQAISYALQYGVPLQALVDKFSHVRFEPSGMTKNPDVRFAKSIVDYIFRWMASKFLSPEAQFRAGVNNRDEAESKPQSVMLEIPVPRVGNVETVTATVSTTKAVVPAASQFAAMQNQEDAPPCTTCGSIMVRSGSCYKCSNCGTTSGCA